MKRSATAPGLVLIVDSCRDCFHAALEERRRSGMAVEIAAWRKRRNGSDADRS